VAGSSVANARGRYDWEDLPEPKLLDLRLCDLGIALENSRLEEPIHVVLSELTARNLRVRPHFWLSEEWFSPEGVPGVALPFYLAHPRLMRLERKHMLEVEGGTRAACTRLLRHEVGHAVQHAFALHRRRRWQRAFGKSSRAYPEYYRPNAASRRYVLHLDYWYAQAHPDEDFAETFAVWLTPGSRWRRRYRGWPALRKLEYVDELMSDLAGRAPTVRSRRRVEPLGQIRKTLRQHYIEKRDRFGALTSNIYDADLRRIFSDGSSRGGMTAARFLRENRVEIRRMVAKGTGKHEYTLDVVLGDMLLRCRELSLRAVGPRRDLQVDLAILIAARSVQYVYGGREWHAL
jgi:hypothetical protein